MKADIHLHKRERVHLKKQEYPHPDPKIHFLDDVVTILSYLMPLSAIPQIYTIYSTQNASGVSVITWSIWLIATIPLILYGMVHKVKPIITMYSLWIVMYIIVIVGAILY